MTCLCLVVSVELIEVLELMITTQLFRQQQQIHDGPDRDLEFFNVHTHRVSGGTLQHPDEAFFKSLHNHHGQMSPSQQLQLSLWQLSPPDC